MSNSSSKDKMHGIDLLSWIGLNFGDVMFHDYTEILIHCRSDDVEFKTRVVVDQIMPL